MMSNYPLNNIFPALRAYTLFTALLLLVACSSSETKREIPAVQMTLVAAAQVNPDSKNHAAPVSISIYHLTSVDVFENTDYFSLSAGEDINLNRDIVKSDNFILIPGESREIEINPGKEVRALGITAAFRKIEQAEWQKVYLLKKDDDRPWYRKFFSPQETKLTVRFEDLAISINEME